MLVDSVDHIAERLEILNLGVKMVAARVFSLLSGDALVFVVPNSFSPGDFYYSFGVNPELGEVKVERSLVVKAVAKTLTQGAILQEEGYVAFPVGERIVSAVVLLLTKERPSLQQCEAASKLLIPLKIQAESLVLLRDMSLNGRISRLLVELVLEADQGMQKKTLDPNALIDKSCSRIKERLELDFVRFFAVSPSYSVHECYFSPAQYLEMGMYTWDVTPNHCPCPYCIEARKLHLGSLLMSRTIVGQEANYVLVFGQKELGRFNRNSLDRANLMATTIHLLLENLRRMRESDSLLQKLKEQNANLSLSYRATLESLLKALESRDYDTHGHSQRVMGYAIEIAKVLGFSPSELKTLTWAAVLHDIGKIGIRDATLLKPGRLSEEEWKEIRRHPEIGYRMLRGVPFLEEVPLIVLHHHERFDGKGYPEGLKENTIPLSARILSVADAFDAITSRRVYRPVRSLEEGLREIERNGGSQFCPLCVKGLLLVSQDKLKHIREEKVEGDPLYSYVQWA